MKKSELKNIIKECVKEVIFEEGVLSGIITEVAQGLQGSTPIRENSMAIIAEASKKSNSSPGQDETRKKVMAAIANDYSDVKNKFSNPALFEGTKPLPSDSKGALAGVAPSDTGIDLTSIPGLGNWSRIAEGNRK
jgi:hypothetical protein